MGFVLEASRLKEGFRYAELGIWGLRMGAEFPVAVNLRCNLSLSPDFSWGLHVRLRIYPILLIPRAHGRSTLKGERMASYSSESSDVGIRPCFLTLNCIDTC